MKPQFELGPEYESILDWFASKHIYPFDYQIECWTSYLSGCSGIVNAPTGFGKTFSLFMAFMAECKDCQMKNQQETGLQYLWITPLRALARDLHRIMTEVAKELALPIRIGIRTGDTLASEKNRQKLDLPEVLISTPESVHVLLAQQGYTAKLAKIKCIVVDEWHELLGNKRGTQVELALARLKSISQTHLAIWGISATIGNMSQAMEVLLGNTHAHGVLIKPNWTKKISILPLFPDEIERYPWTGHLGTKLLSKLIPLIEAGKSTLIFTNTRGQAEIWYQELIKHYPEWAGLIALHHGSMDKELRSWVEQAIQDDILKAVICTSSLDLGVDFRPVDQVVQIGSPKGVARFMQRAGRSGHSPFETNRIYFLPTNTLELMEVAALKEAIEHQTMESREPVVLAFDVLMQFLTTLAVSDGFDAKAIYLDIKNTFAFKEITLEEWQWVLNFLHSGGNTFNQYDEFHKLDRLGTFYRVNNRKIATRHRMNIGTIVSEVMVQVRTNNGTYIGVIEEYFISRLQPGECFSLAGQVLEFRYLKDNVAVVSKSRSKKFTVPSWLGGRMPLSSPLADIIRRKLDTLPDSEHVEMQILTPIWQVQQKLSLIPKSDELLVECITTEEGFHVFIYPFEGRLVHEVMAALMAYRLGKQQAVSISMAMNDYGFELLCDREVAMTPNEIHHLLNLEYLTEDIYSSINATELARRKFRDIACIAGLVFQGFPTKQKKDKHLQSSASLIFNVIQEFDPGNLLYRQAFHEAYVYQMEEVRLRQALLRINNSKIRVQHPRKFTPFSFPIKVDSMRQNLSSESLESRIRKMTVELETR